ncbi:uncharacterized protein BJ212DRAFT_727507 [Suillus subaureus]|uniref:T4 RNA ligase 1-like N-terminal domain-containing protein n=1 Tax=Suillus subaureus TaxID=48587 RepID=A0A9P7J8D7_9AGAM|nr:uncharacterized protein BJ212DRAFT_727507 [Suillus subaureus]KAG1807820.1 hypothetical protein BJ212DRAFT_727507 [Suillus subaureus]
MLARGLFSHEIPCGDDSRGEQECQIVARGYDKFFNIGEVPCTDVSCFHVKLPDIASWGFVRGGQYSPTGPTYTLSLKSKGCIIFVAPISPPKLIVTSKQCTGIDARGLRNSFRSRLSVAQ